eukprot:m.215544 g.215544  ORF g.215544 m.215544 type:complete len:547 (+) comp27938_c0_seq1:315-1955(+)
MLTSRATASMASVAQRAMRMSASHRRALHWISHGNTSYTMVPIGPSTPGMGSLWPGVQRRGNHTVYALATGAPPTAIAVMRVTGPCAVAALEAMLWDQRVPAPSKAAVRKLYPPRTALNSCQSGLDTPASGVDALDVSESRPTPLDQAVVITWRAPHSYTGEDVVELHLHGGPAVVTAVSAALGSVPNVRPATPGEFTRRAFQNGKMDLTQVEGVHDLITAETEMQRVQAMKYVSAETVALYDGWCADLLNIMAHIEAFIDFGEDEGIEDDVMQNAFHRLRTLRAAMSAHVDSASCGERLRRGVRVAVVGLPNAGKSTLMNYLCGREAAIVSDSPGTTRDVIEVSCDVGGFPVVLLDTAGVRYGEDIHPVEVEGVRRAESAAATADLCMCVQDAAAGGDAVCPLASHGGTLACRCVGGPPRIIMPVLNKVDLSEATPLTVDATPDTVLISCKTKHGLDTLVERLHATVQDLCGGSGAMSAPLIQGRHRRHLLDCIDGIDRVLNDPNDVVVAAEELRVASEQFGFITGRFDTESILDVVFADFCIGK